MASLGLFCMPSQAHPSLALDGEAWLALVTLEAAPGGRRAALPQETGREPELLHTPSSSPAETGREEDIDPDNMQRWCIQESD